ncbi:MAG: 3-deoxy-8-phosphooctulonate synthase [Candidatus Marinimicrobia bacterium]|nr:3-deoxy-8-phosphooctulonate synthase [Candidatus Neomarinimicrobiota bacterium]
MPDDKTPEIIFGGDALPLLAGPCVIESRDHTLKMAESIRDIAAKLEIPFIFKSSFDKANRTSIQSYRGPGMEEGLKILEDVKNKLGVKIITDIHTPEQAQAVAEVVDVLQIPAFLCRQTDLLVAAAKTGKPVNVKRGQFLSPQKMKHVVQKLEDAGTELIFLTERGSTFGHEGLVTDLRAIPIMQETGHPVIFDATHSAQIPGSGNERTGGLREYIPIMVRAAVAAGCDGLFIEVHDDPENALSDAATQWPLYQLEELLTEAISFRKTFRELYA